VWFIFGAAAFDALDGRLARMGGRESLFGAEFDSIADVVSFGLAPTLMMFFFILSPTQGILEWFRNIGWAVGFIYLLCAAMRLARFNVITNPLLRPGKKESNQRFRRPARARRRRHRRRPGAVSPESRRIRQISESVGARAAVSHAPDRLLMMSTIRYPSGKGVDFQTKTRPHLHRGSRGVRFASWFSKLRPARRVSFLYLLRPHPPLAASGARAFPCSVEPARRQRVSNLRAADPNNSGVVNNRALTRKPCGVLHGVFGARFSSQNARLLGLFAAYNEYGYNSLLNLLFF
jgi:hypothetical protein